MRWQVRRRYWVILACALSVAMLVPLVSYWQGWQSPLVLSVQLVPQHPQVGQTAQLIVTLHKGTWSLTQQTQLRVLPEMIAMPMVTRQMTIPTDGSGAHYLAWLTFPMAGVWQVHLQLSPPAHAQWDAWLAVRVEAGALSWVAAPSA